MKLKQIQLHINLLTHQEVCANSTLLVHHKEVCAHSELRQYEVAHDTLPFQVIL
jgi:hypothetical protein